MNQNVDEDFEVLKFTFWYMELWIPGDLEARRFSPEYSVGFQVDPKNQL